MRWMSIPITRCISCSFQLRWTGAVGDTTTTDPRSRRNRVGHRGGQLTTRALGSLYRNGLPTDVLPVPLVPGWSHHTPGPSCPSRMSEHRDPHTGYQRYRAAAWRVQATDQRNEELRSQRTAIAPIIPARIAAPNGCRKKFVLSWPSARRKMAPAPALTNISIAAEKCWTPKITANATAPAAAASVKSHVGAGGDRAMSSIVFTATSGPRRPDTTFSIARIVDVTRFISTPAG